MSITNNYNDKGTFRGSHVTELSLQSGSQVRNTSKFAGSRQPGETFSRSEGRSVGVGQTPAAAPTGGSGRTFNQTGRLEPGITGVNTNGRGRGCWTCHSPDHKQAACPGNNRAKAANRPARANACRTLRRTVGAEAIRAESVVDSPYQSPDLDGRGPADSRDERDYGRPGGISVTCRSGT